MVEDNGFEVSHAQRNKHRIVGAIWNRRRAVGDSIPGARTCVKHDPVVSFRFNLLLGSFSYFPLSRSE